MTLLIGALTIGLILSLLALGTFISYRVFNFADITAEGSITLGASVSAALIVAGINPLTATLAAMVCGALAGALTGTIHTKFGINGLLAGILVMTGLYSVNLHVMGRSNLPLMSLPTVTGWFSGLAGPASDTNTVLGVPAGDFAVLLCMFVLAVLVAVLVYLFFRTSLGTAMRATGDNPQMIRAQGVDTQLMIILGLSLSNALIALSGSLLAQFQGFADVQMGIGMLVWGLASVIIGEALITDKSTGFLIAGAIFGSVIFRLLVAGALRMGMNPNDLKVVTAIFVFAALVLPKLLNRKKNPHRSDA